MDVGIGYTEGLMDEDSKNMDEGIQTTAKTSNDAAEDLVTITNLIKNYLTQIDRQQKELAEHRQMLEDAFANEPTYQEQNEKVKEATKVRNGTKAQILKQPTLIDLANKIKDMRAALKEARENLSGYLQEYAKLSGEQQFENTEGEVLQIVYTARLVRVGAR